MASIRAGGIFSGLKDFVSREDRGTDPRLFVENERRVDCQYAGCQGEGKSACEQEGGGANVSRMGIETRKKKV